MTSPIFFDASGRRRRRVTWTASLLLALLLLIAAAFALTVFRVPAASALSFGQEREQPLPFLTHIARLRHRLPHAPPAVPASGPQLRVGFYVPWDEQSRQSLSQHFDQLDWVVAAEGQIDPAHGAMIAAPDRALDAIATGRLHTPQIHLMVQNAANERFDGPGMARILTDRAAGDRIIAQTIAAVKARKWTGAMFDIENIEGTAIGDYAAFLERAHPQFRRAGLTLSATVPAGEPDWNLRRFAASTDRLIFMAYDQHWQGGEAGPVAAQDWLIEQIADAHRQIPATKLIVAIGEYGYDWHRGSADAMTVNEAWLAARDSGTVPQWDPVSGNTGFAFEDNGEQHTVWLLDAATTWNQLRMIGPAAGIALWRLGSEDPGFWDALTASRNHAVPALGTLAPAPGTDVDGSGELLRIAALPSGGKRTLNFLPDHQIASETFQILPSPYKIKRTGGADPKAIALTFDDGPDADWTPAILDILEAKHVPAAFFVVGENAIIHPQLLQRIIADGDELGNHSYTHPNLAQESALGTRLELNSTQRLIEAYTGRSTRLFRAPYFGDAEPTTADELGPALLAQKAGYTIVGLHIDSEDWQRPGVAKIVANTMTSLHAASSDSSRNIVLLHDGGGNRSQTVAALPLIIDQMRAEGYHFTTTAALAGTTPDVLMPRVAGSDRIAVGADVGIFLLLAAFQYAIRFLFFFAIALGLARALVLTALALIDHRWASPAPEAVDSGTVSVIIPAFNEEAVIVASIARVLASDYAAIEIVVADDGSSDRTGALVTQHYGADPRVRLLTLVNGGKAAALNRALRDCASEIVISLDADTQFLPDTISKLVRWFADPAIGAVAGNAQVGNRVNLLTRWQAIEYVTAQNVERRALDSLRAITVVPGAVGAWRRAALDAVGGYPEDTLAEDQDLTIAIQRVGWRVAYDVSAVALTEAPETFAALAKQRFRGSFGTLQCLWKHRDVLKQGRPRGLAWFGMPQAWLFQIVFAAISPMIDLALIVSIFGTALRITQHGWAQTQSDVLRMGVYWTAFVAIDLLAGWTAYRLEPQRMRFPALLMIAQRVVYRQLMYSVVIRSIAAALRGRMVGWGKLERTGRVMAGAN